MKEKLLKHSLFLIPVLILLIIQIPNLGLPYFWDEAWSYFPAIKKMAEVGPSLLPGALPIDYCKGHPQMFFFISSLWMKLFPNSITMMRLLPILISISLLITVYIGLLKMANWPTAITATVLISVQSLFLAQSIFLLPEMLSTVFFVLSFFFFLQKKFIAYGITSSLMVLTKETAIIFALVFGLFYLISLFSKANKEKYKRQNLIAILIPGIVYLLFLLLHYLKFNTAFYTSHFEYIQFDWNVIVHKLKSTIPFIFVHYGRLTIFISSFFLLILWLLQKQRSSHFLILGILSLLAYIIFSVFNFYTHRYMLVAMITFILLFSFMLGQIKLNHYIKAGITIIISCICLYYSLTDKHNTDNDLGYIETVMVQKGLVQFCEENNLYNDPLAVTFNMSFALSDGDLGYVKGTDKFNKIMDSNHYHEASYYIYENTADNNPTLDFVKEHFKLIKTITLKHALGSIYENPDYQNPVVPAIR